MSGKKLMKTTALCATTLALSLAFVAAPTVVGVPGFDDAAYAQGKSGDKGNKGGNGKAGGTKAVGKDKASSGGGGGKGKGGGLGNMKLKDVLGLGKSKKTKTKKTVSKGKGSAKKAAAAGTAVAATEATATDTMTTTEAMVDLHPKQKGRWNANPNQKAIDAHIRNQNFNGTVGMLSQYELALKAQDPNAELNEHEQAALDTLFANNGLSLSDGPTEMDVSDFLNETYGDETLDKTYSYEGGVVSCEGDDCEDDLSGIQTDAELWEDVETTDAEMANEQAYDDLLSLSEQNILDNSNKSTEGIEEPLLDTIAHNLGFDRQSIIAEPEEELPIDEEVTEDLDPEAPVDPELPEDEEVVIIIE